MTADVNRSGGRPGPGAHAPRDRSPADAQGALKFVQEVIAGKLECARTPGHHTAFEGDRGHGPAHFTQKGEGMHTPHEHSE